MSEKRIFQLLINCYEYFLEDKPNRKADKFYCLRLKDE